MTDRERSDRSLVPAEDRVAMTEPPEVAPLASAQVTFARGGNVFLQEPLDLIEVTPKKRLLG